MPIRPLQLGEVAIFIFGESGSIFVFALTAATIASRYSYKTFPELVDKEYFSDKYVRAISGIIMARPGVAWLGGQAMGIGYIFELLTGTDAKIVTLVSLGVFITYTTMGGFVAVARADFSRASLYNNFSYFLFRILQCD